MDNKCFVPKICEILLLSSGVYPTRDPACFGTTPRRTPGRGAGGWTGDKKHLRNYTDCLVTFFLKIKHGSNTQIVYSQRICVFFFFLIEGRDNPWSALVKISICRCCAGQSSNLAMVNQNLSDHDVLALLPVIETRPRFRWWNCQSPSKCQTPTFQGIKPWWATGALQHC